MQIAVGLAQEAPVLIADEPTSHLDLGATAAVARLLRRLADDGLAVLLVVHDLALAAAVADRVVVMSRGRAVAAGPAAEVLDAERLAEVWSVDAELEFADGRTALHVAWLGGNKNLYQEPIQWPQRSSRRSPPRRPRTERPRSRPRLGCGPGSALASPRPRERHAYHAAGRRGHGGRVGDARHVGAVRLRRGRRGVTLSDWQTRLGTRSTLTARVGGRRITVLTVARRARLDARPQTAALGARARR